MHNDSIYYSDEQLKSHLEILSNFQIVEGNIFGSHEPSHEDITQSTISDCYLLAALKAIMRRDPSFIKEMVRELKNGHIAVRFYEKSGDEIHQHWYEMDKTNVKHIANAVFGHHAPWVYFVEKAYTLHRLRTNSLKENRQQLKYAEILHGGYSKEIFTLLLGCEGNEKILPHPQKTFMTLLDELVEIPSLTVLDLFFKANNELSVKFMNALIMQFRANEFNHSLILVAAVNLRMKMLANNAKASDVINFFKSYFPKMDKTILDIIELTAIQSFDIQLGENKYSPDSIKFYEYIRKQLMAGDLMCISSKETLKNTNTAGLVPNHAYEILNCYQKIAACFC